METMSLPWAVHFALAFAVGIASHVLIFVHGELNNYAVIILQAFIAGWLLLIILAFFSGLSLAIALILGSLLFLTFMLGLGLSITTYRLFFHRLRHFPGHWPYILTKWTATRYAYRTNRYFALLRTFHDKYGDFVRTG